MSKHKNNLVVMYFFFAVISDVAIASSNEVNSATKLISTSAVCKYQDTENICSYSGKASLAQGTTELRAQQITIHRDVNGKISKIVASGEHSSYSSAISGNAKSINASANLIIIYPDKSMLVLEGNGKIISGLDKYSAPHIEYKFK